MVNFDEVAGRDARRAAPPELPQTFFLAARRNYGSNISVRGFKRLGDLKNSNFFSGWHVSNSVKDRTSYWAVVNGTFVPLTWDDISNARGQTGLFRLLVEKAYGI